MGAQADGWRFKTGPSGRWIWQRLSSEGDVLSESALDFPLIEECALDAQRCGYGGILGAYASTE